MNNKEFIYIKPNLTNLPKKEGKMIINEIVNAKAPNQKKLEKNAKTIEIKLMEHMKKYA